MSSVYTLCLRLSYNERQGLMWKALYQKDAFIAGVTAIRDEMLATLTQNRDQIASDLQFERMATH